MSVSVCVVPGCEVENLLPVRVCLCVSFHVKGISAGKNFPVNNVTSAPTLTLCEVIIIRLASVNHQPPTPPPQPPIRCVLVI